MSTENAGTIEAELRLKIDSLKKDAMTARKEIESLTARLKTAEDRTNAMGSSLGKNFAAAVKQAGSQVNIFGVSLNAALGPIGIVIGVAITAFNALKSAIGFAKDISEKHKKAIEEQKTAIDLLKISTEDYNKIAGQLSKTEEKEIDNRALLAVAEERQAEILQTLRTAYEAYERALAAGNKTEAKRQLAIHEENRAIYENLLVSRKKGLALAEEMRGMKLLDEEEISRRQAMGKTQKTTEDYVKLQMTYKNTIDDITLARKREIITEEEKSQAEMSANKTYLDGLIAARNEIQRNNTIRKSAKDEQLAYYDTEIKKQAALYEEQKKQTDKTLTTQDKIDAEREAAIKRREEAERRANDALKAGFTDTAGYTKQIADAYAQEYSDLEAIIAKYELTDVTGKTMKLREEVTALAHATQTVADYQKQYTDETARLKAGYEQISAEMGNETTLASLMATEAEKRAAALEKQRNAELAALKTRYDAIAASRESGQLTAEEISHRDMLTDAINKNYNALRQLSDTEAVTAAQQDILEYGKEIRNQYQGILKDITGEEAIQNRLVALALEQTNQQKAQKTLNDLNREAALEEVEKYFDKIAAQRESGSLRRRRPLNVKGSPPP